MPLPTLKSKLPMLRTSAVRMLEAKAGATPMERGSAWMAKRQRVAERFGWRCAACGLALMPGRMSDGRSFWQCDHIVSREQGGSNDESNLQPLCTTPCHEAKTAQEAAARLARGSYDSKPNPGTAHE
ncbi:HNH endonuclease signature motif containing protein [uncultured Pseudacidovorax sp.]|uniref:HNH endonuclease n=1 Tax=uncultured Pseudacidovorax sp. TaxID=679313 RepID=UPI0025EFA146|nr:HNH endonuclease signature motif containing protein [uncultured Pseudacidovorax sp.]